MVLIQILIYRHDNKSLQLVDSKRALRLKVRKESNMDENSGDNVEIVEGIGNEVIFFGLGSLFFLVLLYNTVRYMFRQMEPPRTEPPQSPSPGRTRTVEVDCCICLGETRLGLETNCGHIYCGGCILEVWRRSASLAAMTCPYCRQRVTLLLPYFR